MAEQKQRDLVTPVVVTVGTVGIGAGLYLYFRKPKGVDPGDTLEGVFNFDYNGGGGDYILQVNLGRIIIGGWFDHVEGLTWELEVMLPKPAELTQHWDFIVLCRLPEAVEPGAYDGEATIRRKGMDKRDYLVKVTAKNVITVRKS